MSARRNRKAKRPKSYAERGAPRTSQRSAASQSSKQDKRAGHLPTKQKTAWLTSKIKDKRVVEEKPRPKLITGWHLWLFRIACLTLIPALFFSVLELSLRAAGYGYRPSATIECKVNGMDAIGDNVKFGWRFFPRHLAREFQPFIFPADKPDDTYRIFVLGASAAKGEPDAAFCFGRFLRTMLRDAYPATNFEVITAAAAAINSHVVLQTAKDCARHEPDLFIVYLGNNEVTGPYGAGTVFAPLSRSLPLIRIGIALKTTRLGQLLTNLVESIAQKNTPAIWRGMGMFLEKQVRADDPQLETVYRHFQRNLEDISRIARKSGGRIVFCTVASNLKDCPPFASLHRPDLAETDKQQWDTIYQQGVAYETAGKYAEAVRRYLAAAEIDDCYAELQFRLGRCYWAVQQYDKARERYIRARELDTLRFRADTQINDIIRAVATDSAKQGVYLVEAVKTFEQNSHHKVPGGQLFHEHVHLNFKGNYLLAKTIFGQVEQILPDRIKNAKLKKRQLLAETECARRLAYTDWDREKIADEILNGFVRKAPFTNQLDHAQRVRQMQEELYALKANLTQDALEKSADQYRQAIQDDSDDWVLHWKYGKLLAEGLKDYQAAAKEYRLVQDFLPHSYTVYNALGSVLRGLGDLDGASTQYRKAIRIKPTCGDAYYYLGWAYQKQGKTEKAVRYYHKAVRWQPDCMPAYNNLAEILYQQGKIDQAVKICRKGLLFVPDSPILHCNLGTLLRKQGRRNEAIKELKVALELDPNSTEIRKILEAVSRTHD
jgi:tetratricopeptide (TPR) repeat protein